MLRGSPLRQPSGIWSSDCPSSFPPTTSPLLCNSSKWVVGLLPSMTLCDCCDVQHGASARYTSAIHFVRFLGVAASQVTCMSKLTEHIAYMSTQAAVSLLNVCKTCLYISSLCLCQWYLAHAPARAAAIYMHVCTPCSCPIAVHNCSLQ